MFELHSLLRARRDSCLRARESPRDRDDGVDHEAEIQTARVSCCAVREASPRKTVVEGLNETHNIETVVLSTVELTVGVVGIAAPAATVVIGKGDEVIERVIEKFTRQDPRVSRGTHRPT